ncbi:winged helix-turn-helix domain-containing protein [Deinococcus alpinitundrae]|uniref:winged helix-turn-helix domain-containing protein n=1 Tax=Deinococcus alpinitundrae TaxID=468913 RepID=UPI00137B10E5|nr:winged helix-turn-helix domain-containing protein [Deinococcus alpinitundrae]
MVLFPDISGTAALLADPTRAQMLTQLLSGQSFTAGELAREADVSPQTASNHLTRLLAAGLVQVEPQGRHRYFRLANRDVAQLLEALIAFEQQKIRLPVSRTPARLRFARRCYDHLAGELGVLLLDALRQKQWVMEHEGGLTLASTGERWMASLGIDIQTIRGKRRPLVRPCLDWSERRPHLAGAVGAALLNQFLERRWLVVGQHRELHLTTAGQQQFEQNLDLRLQSAVGREQEE